MTSLKDNILFKIGIITVLILLLLIPTSMVQNLIREREQVQQEAIYEVSSKWGEQQTITGPILSIPYDKYIKQTNPKDSTTKIVKIKDWIHLLPDDLIVEGDIQSNKRKRAIYEVVVYQSQLNLKGSFDKLDLQRFDIAKGNIHFDRAILNLGISDLKGIEKQINLKWNGKTYDFSPGVPTTDVIGTGINCNVPIDKSDSAKYNFNLALDLKGSQSMRFVPVGKTTDVRLGSNWTNPSYGGNTIPDDHTTTESGFNAHWNMLHLNRNYPQGWVGNRYNVNNTAFGVDLLLPVDSYQKSMRVAKYSVLFIVLTFLIFFFVEVLNKIHIHPVQYILVGIALVVFYSLLLAFSEHMAYNLSYILSAVLTIGLVTAYIRAILKSKQLTLLIFSILSVLYAFIFTIIQLQNYALLIGSIGVFVILAISMYFSRKIDWYALKMTKE